METTELNNQLNKIKKIHYFIRFCLNINHDNKKVLKCTSS